MELSTDSPDLFPLTAEHHMLLHVRDTLYEGDWGDFVSDLTARAGDRPHVFATVPTSPDMRSTIEHHLTMIDDMRRWEDGHGQALQPAPAHAPGA